MKLELKNISKVANGITHIKPVNLLLEPASMNILLGPTGSGKTSLMRLMAGLDHPTTGQVFWDGEDVTRKRLQTRDIAMVYQQFINYPSMSVYDNIASPLRIKKRPSQEIDERVQQVATLLGLTEILHRKPLEISGGQQQRCALARALVKEARLVLLDEPLANLDYKLREALREEIPKIFAQSGAIFVYATTEPEEALLLGGNTATLWDGSITQFGKTSEMYRQPQNSITAKLFSDPPMNFLPLKKEGGKIHFDDRHEIDATDYFSQVRDGKYLAGFRPDHLMLSKRSEDAIAFEAILSVVEITGSETFCHVNYGKNAWISLRHGIRDLKTDTALQVYIQPKHIYLFDEKGDLVQAAAYTQTDKKPIATTPTIQK